MFDIRIPELIKLIRAVSEEEALDRIIARQLSTIRDLIRFQKGYFLCFEGEQLLVKAECHLESDMQTDLCSIPFEEFPHLSHAFVNRVVRTRKPLLLEHPSNDSRFAEDPYFRATVVKVVMGLPLLCNHQWLGLFYFQNGPAGGTFPSNQIQLLGALSEPMAIALEKGMRISSLSRSYKALRKETAKLRQGLRDSPLKQALALADSLARGKARLTAHLLHKIGNEINSLGLIRELIQEQFEDSHIEKLFKATKLLANHRDQLAAYLTEDPKGRLLPRYLSGLDGPLKRERKVLLDDLKKMGAQVESMKKLLVQLRDRAKLEAGLTALELLRLIDDILELECKRLPRGTVSIEKTFERSMLLVRVPRSNLVFILKYLVKKTIEALESRPPGQRGLSWSIQETNPEWVRIIIADAHERSESQPLARMIEQGPGNKDDAFYSGLRDSIAEMETLGCEIDIMVNGSAGFSILLPRAEQP